MEEEGDDDELDFGGRRWGPSHTWQREHEGCRSWVPYETAKRARAGAASIDALARPGRAVEMYGI